MLTSWFRYDFGYSWPFTLGHLLVCAAGVLVLGLAAWRSARPWVLVAGGVLTLWGLAGAIAMHDAVQINEPARIPAAFMASGSGRVLDLGAGSGRATVGLLLARPQVRVTALDRYEGYYGIDDNTSARLMRNAGIAGVADRAEVRVADMRQLPFADGEFDAAMSVAAIDHLAWSDIEQAMRETARVLKPGGQFLVVSLNSDAWVRVAIPPAIHGTGFWGSRQLRERWGKIHPILLERVIVVPRQPGERFRLRNLAKHQLVTGTIHPYRGEWIEFDVEQKPGKEVTAGARVALIYYFRESSRGAKIRERGLRASPQL